MPAYVNRFRAVDYSISRYLGLSLSSFDLFGVDGSRWKRDADASGVQCIIDLIRHPDLCRISIHVIFHPCSGDKIQGKIRHF